MDVAPVEAALEGVVVAPLGGLAHRLALLLALHSPVLGHSFTVCQPVSTPMSFRKVALAAVLTLGKRRGRAVEIARE